MVWLVKAAKIYLWFGSREGAPVWCTVGAGGQRARSLGRHLEVGLGKESKERRKGGNNAIGWLCCNEGNVFFHATSIHRN